MHIEGHLLRATCLGIFKHHFFAYTLSSFFLNRKESATTSMGLGATSLLPCCGLFSLFDKKVIDHRASFFFLVDLFFFGNKQEIWDKIIEEAALKKTLEKN